MLCLCRLLQPAPRRCQWQLHCCLPRISCHWRQRAGSCTDWRVSLSLGLAAVSVFLYALLTVLFMVAGLAYIILPQLTLKWTFGWVRMLLIGEERGRSGTCCNRSAVLHGRKHALLRSTLPCHACF